MDGILRYVNYPWKWEQVSKNPNIRLEHVLQNPELPWNWKELSSNENITYEDVMRHPEKPWDWEGLVKNPNFTFAHIENNLDKVTNWKNISSNTMKLGKQRFICDKLSSYRLLLKQLARQKPNVPGDIFNLVDCYL